MFAKKNAINVNILKLEFLGITKTNKQTKVKL